MITKLFSFSLILLLTACVDYKEVELIAVEDIDLKKISTEGIELDIAVKIKNPNDYKITVDTKDFVFSINNNPVGNADLVKPLILTKSSVEVYTTKVLVKLPSNGNINLGKILLLSGGTIKVNLIGLLVGNAKGFSKEVPFNFTETISI